MSRQPAMATPTSGGNSAAMTLGVDTLWGTPVTTTLQAWGRV